MYKSKRNTRKLKQLKEEFRLKVKHKILKLMLVVLILLNTIIPIVNAQTCTVGEDISLVRIWCSKLSC